MKHTKGPWYERILEAENLSRTKLITAKIGEVKVDICRLLFTSVLILEEREANARLIASAPELLEALEHIVEYWNRDRNDKAMHDALWHIIEVAEQVISKAEGDLK